MSRRVRRRRDLPTGAGRGGPGTRKSPDAVEARIEDLAELLEQGYKLLHAAERLGICYRTAVRYRNRLRARQGEVDERQIDRRSHRVETDTSRRGSDRQGVSCAAGDR